MEKNVFEIVAEILKTNTKYISEDGKLLKVTVYSDVMTMNKELLSLLLYDLTIQDTEKNYYTKIHVDRTDLDGVKIVEHYINLNLVLDYYSKSI